MLFYRHLEQHGTFGHPSHPHHCHHHSTIARCQLGSILATFHLGLVLEVRRSTRNGAESQEGQEGQEGQVTVLDAGVLRVLRGRGQAAVAAVRTRLPPGRALFIDICKFVCRFMNERMLSARACVRVRVHMMPFRVSSFGKYVRKRIRGIK